MAHTYFVGLPVTSIACLPSSDSQLLFATGSGAPRVRPPLPSLPPPSPFSSSLLTSLQCGIQIWSWNGPDGLEPVVEGHIRQDHPITSLQYLPSRSGDSHRLVSTNVKGYLSVTRVESDVEGFVLKPEFKCKVSHAPATSLDVQGEHDRVVTVGEDGTYALWDAHAEKLLVEPTQVSESSLNCVRWISQDSFVMASHASDVQVWDMRSSKVEPVRVLKEQVAVEEQTRSSSSAASASASSLHIGSVDRRVWSVDNNPARPWLIGSAVSGPSQDLRPTVMFHDLRAAPHPVLINASLHLGHIWQLQFNPQHTDHVITASDDGTLLDWDTASAFEATTTLKPSTITAPKMQQHQRKQNVRRLRNDGLPINHFQIDSHHNLVISASDAESLTFNTDLIV